MSRGMGAVERRALYWLQRDSSDLRGFGSSFETVTRLSTPDLAYLIYFGLPKEPRNSFFRTREIAVSRGQLNSTNRALNRLLQKQLVFKEEEKAAYRARVWTAAPLVEEPL
ncbi:hypothetical protein YH62_10870 [Rhizobium sp. LC145]|nr:hypothetical protein YH62_10870 [Rhizobium sp. LC145]